MNHKANMASCRVIVSFGCVARARPAISNASFNQHEQHLNQIKLSRIQTSSSGVVYTYAPNLSNENLKSEKSFRRQQQQVQQQREQHEKKKTPASHFTLCAVVGSCFCHRQCFIILLMRWNSEN